MSGADVPYRLRPNKTVDREVFAELLAYIDRYRPMREHLYIGFGGPSLEDFRLIHSRFGNTGLISIEQDDTAYGRQLFNRPFNCIHCLNLTSGDFIATFEKEVARVGLDPNSNRIVWLDYASPRDLRKQMEEYAALLTKLKIFDVVKVTLNANPDTLRPALQAEAEEVVAPVQPEELRRERLAELDRRLGDLLPQGTTTAMMTRSGYPGVLARTLANDAYSVMKSRPDTRLEPLLAFRYSDGPHQMLTAAAMLLPASDVQRFYDITRLRSWDLIATAWDDIKEIAVPSLTDRERHSIEEELPRSTLDAILSKPGLVLHVREDRARAILEQYQRFYRYYPLFQRVYA